MTPGARIAAAIEILDDVEASRRPVAEVLKDWGPSHRFAGSKDRSAIATLVFDALRKRASSAYLMGAETGRAIMLGALREVRGMSVEEIAALFSGAAHAPSPPDESERLRLADADLADAPIHFAGDFPAWL